MEAYTVNPSAAVVAIPILKVMKDYNIKSIRQDFKQKGIFYTQRELAEYIKNLLPANVNRVYDPTCGNGGLLSVFDDNVEKYGQDINAQQVEEAANRLKNFHGVAGDTLKTPAFKDMKFDYIVANPPFSIKWEPFQDVRFNAPVLPPPSKADYAFNLHILHYLSDKGIAAVLNFPGILYRGNREGIIRQWLVEQNYIEKVIAIAGNKFADTSIATCVIVYNKSKQNTDILFIDDETGRQRNVSFEEVKENRFNLSVNLYIQSEIKKEEIDPINLDKEAREAFLSRLRKELLFEKTVCEFESELNFQKFLSDIQTIIDEFKE